jgi:NAD(P)-dependent dehydrogenase (short-subunit alcohol dehydrogenase family)
VPAACRALLLHGAELLAQLRQRLLEQGWKLTAVPGTVDDCHQLVEVHAGQLEDPRQARVAVQGAELGSQPEKVVGDAVGPRAWFHDGQRFVDGRWYSASVGTRGAFAPFERIEDREWDQVMAVNVKGMWLCSEAVVPTMRQQGRGRIVNRSSDRIWMGVPMMLHYVASKGAILAFTRALARELAGTGITVKAITPGLTLTDGVRGLADAATIDAIRTQVVSQQIVKRDEDPEDLIGALAFLASDDAAFVSGQTINVNGGATHH